MMKRTFGLLLSLLVPTLVSAFDESSVAMVQKGYDEVHINADLSARGYKCPRQKVAVKYEQWVLAEASDDLVRPPTMILVQPREATAEWLCDGILSGSWNESESEASFLSLTEDFFLEGALPRVSPTMRLEELPEDLTDVAQDLSTVVEAGVEEFFRQLPQTLIEGSDVYSQFPRTLRMLQTETPAEVSWKIQKEERDSHIVADVDIIIKEMELDLTDGNLSLPGLAWIPHAELIGEIVEELLSVVDIQDTYLSLTIEAAIHGSWNPENLLEHSRQTNVYLLFETTILDEPCKFEIDVHSNLSSVRET